MRHMNVAEQHSGCSRLVKRDLEQRTSGCTAQADLDAVRVGMEVGGEGKLGTQLEDTFTVERGKVEEKFECGSLDGHKITPFFV